MAVELSDTVMPDAVLYSRALNALKLSGTNRAVLLSGLEAGSGVLSVKTLKEVSVKIFGSFSEYSTKIALETVDEESRSNRRMHGKKHGLPKENQSRLIVLIVTMRLSEAPWDQ